MKSEKGYKFLRDEDQLNGSYGDQVSFDGKTWESLTLAKNNVVNYRTVARAKTIIDPMTYYRRPTSLKNVPDGCSLDPLLKTEKTLNRIRKMSDKEIDEAIWQEVVKASDWELEDEDVFPDYHSSLNQMDHAEETLGFGEQEEMIKNLIWITNIDNGTGGRGVQWFLTHANARQRAEAFLLTKRA